MTPLNPKFPQVVHGLSIPLGMVGYHLPRTISGANLGNSDESGPSRAATNEDGTLEAGGAARTNPEGDMTERERQGLAGVSVPRTVRHMGGTIMEGSEAQPGEEITT